MNVTPLIQCRAVTGRRVHKRTRRTGYTLMELIAVATLMLIAASLAVPLYDGVMSEARVDASGDMIRGRMADARSMAMENGKPFRFAFMPGTGKFQIAADDSDVWSSGAPGSAIEADDHIAGELLQDVVFSTNGGSSGGDGANTTAQTGSGGWAIGGIFLPTGEARGPINPADGTSQDNVTFYFGREGGTMHGVRMLGLTGTVRVFDPTDPNEAN